MPRPFTPAVLGAPPDRFPSFRAEQLHALDLVLGSKKRFIALNMPTGCHALGTKILMHDGSLKPVQDIVIGDVVMGPDSKPRTVLSLHRGRGQMCRIEPVKGEHFVVNMDHLLSVHVTRSGLSSRPSDKQRVETVSVRAYVEAAKSFRHLRKLRRVAVDFADRHELPVQPYFLGVLIGDGHIGKTVGVCTADPEIARLVRQQAKWWGLDVREKWKGANNKATDYYIGRVRKGPGGWKDRPANDLLNTLRGLGVAVVCEKKFIPSMYLLAPRRDRLALLAGLIDTDGSLSNGTIDFVCKSPRLRDDVLFLARSLGLAAYASAKRIDDTVYWRISISGAIERIPTRLPRKRAAKRGQKKNVCVTGFTAVPLGTGDYYGFELDGDHLYVTSDFVVHHNSGKSLLARSLARYLGMRTLILTHSRSLQDLYEQQLWGMVDVRGQQNYPCVAVTGTGTFRRYRHLGTSVAEGPCHHGLRCTLMSGGCTYFDKVTEAMDEEECVSSNYAWWLSVGKSLLTGRTQKEPLGAFELLVLDEAHMAELEVSRALTVTLDLAEVRRTVGMPKHEQRATWQEWKAWGERSMEWLKAELDGLKKEAAAGGLTHATVGEQRRLKRLQEAAEQISSLTADWTVEQRKGLRGAPQMEFQPVLVAPYCEDMLFRGTEKVVLLSATLM